MKPSDVLKAIEEIRAIARDDEAAHSAEDRLYTAILQAIANGTIEDARECARLALTTEEIDFYRWCA